MFIHGTDDPYVSYKSSVDINKKCKNSKIILIDEADHGFHNEAHIIKTLEETIKFIIEV